MSHSITIPAIHARSLVSTIDAIRGETLMLKAAGMLDVCADDLLDGGGSINAWLADLDDALRTHSGSSTIRLAEVEAWTLQHLVYALSAVLVWAHELRLDGRLGTAVSAEALAAWAEVEQAAGLGGRTSMAFGWTTSRLLGRGVDLRPSEASVEFLSDESSLTEAAAAHSAA